MCSSTLATADRFFAPIAKQLAKPGWVSVDGADNKNGGFRRLIECRLYYDLNRRATNKCLLKYLKEEQDLPHPSKYLPIQKRGKHLPVGPFCQNLKSMPCARFISIENFLYVVKRHILVKQVAH